MKYILVSGGVISGIGKGVIGASARLAGLGAFRRLDPRRVQGTFVILAAG